MSEYYVDTLANGLRLVTVPMPHLHAAEIVCYMAVGGQCEEEPLAGISHFLEHMIFRGTTEYPTSILLERAFEAIGGAVNASTDAETTCFHSRVHPTRLSDGVGLFASMLRRPLFKDIDVERRIILEEAREDYNEEGVQINSDNLMAELLWPEHPLGKTLIGSPETLERIDLATLKHYYRQWYRPDTLVICACGPIERGEALRAVTHEFGDWSVAAEQSIPVASGALPTGPRCCWVQDSDSQVSIQLAFRLPGRDDEHSLAARFLCRLLAWGGGARLSLRLREELGLTYAVDAHCSLMKDTGYLAIDLSVAPGNLVLAVKEILGVLEVLRNQAIESEELDGAVRNYLFDLEFSQDQTEAQAVRYGWGLQADYLRTTKQDEELVHNYTPAGLQALAQDIFTKDAAHLVVVGPWGEDDRIAIETMLNAY